MNILPILNPVKYPFIAIPSTTLQIAFLSASIIIAVTTKIKNTQKRKYGVKDFMSKTGD